MIAEDYVSFETAKLLKEKGFNEATIFVYYDFLPSSLCFTKEKCRIGALNLFYYDETTQVNNRFNNSMSIPKYISGGVYSAPTHQMAMKWLREVHKVNIEIHYNRFGENYRYQIIYKPEVLDDIRSLGYYYYYYYEDAVEAALKHSLTNFNLRR